MKPVFSAILLTCLLAIGSPLTAAQPENYLEADGCDVMVYLESLPSGDHTGSWLLESIFSGERYTYTYDQVDALTALDPSGLSARQVFYVNWRLEERPNAKGTNRTEVRLDLTQPVWPFDFDGEIIRGMYYSEGGIGGLGTYDPNTGETVWSSVNLVFCK